MIAGPNGAGKTTFAGEYLSLEGFEFVNADEIARGSASGAGGHAKSDIQAGRVMLERIDQLVEAKADFAIETTLATLTYARKISLWRERGYMVLLFYIRLGSVAESLARVRKRVEAGGHGIPPDAIRRRFEKSLSYFETIYKPIVDEWYMWESREGRFTEIDYWDRGQQ